MRKISIILPNLVGGGAERLAIYLANDWLQRGFQVEFILMKKKGELIPFLDKGISVIDLKAERIRKVFLPLTKHLLVSKPDVIWSGLWPLTSISVLSWLSAGKRGRLFLIDHNFLSISTIRQLKVPSLLLKFIMRLTYPFASGVMTVSHGAKKDLSDLGNFKRDRVKVIYNPAATGKASEYLVSENLKNELWGNKTKFRIVTAGALSHQKNHELLIRAFSDLSKVSSTKLFILGEGELRPKLQRLIKDLNMEEFISMPGFVNEPYPWFLTADLFVLSSDWEGLPTVLVESLECGLPVVSTNCPSGPSEILEEGRYGKLVPVGNQKALTEAIEQSLSEKHDKNSLIKRSKDFSLEKISLEYLDYFKLPHEIQ